MTPNRPAQLGDHLGCQANPPRAVRDRLNAIQPPQSAPGDDRRDIHIQLLSHFLDRTLPVSARAVRTGGRALRTTAWDRICISDPLDLSSGEAALGPGSKSLPIQQGRNLSVG